MWGMKFFGLERALPPGQFKVLEVHRIGKQKGKSGFSARRLYSGN